MQEKILADLESSYEESRRTSGGCSFFPTLCVAFRGATCPLFEHPISQCMWGEGVPLVARVDTTNLRGVVI